MDSVIEIIQTASSFEELDDIIRNHQNLNEKQREMLFQRMCWLATEGSPVIQRGARSDEEAISYNRTGDKKCFDMYVEYMECTDPTGCGNSIAWDYQACTEVVLPSGTDGQSSMFPYLPMTPEMRKTYREQKYGVTPRTDWLDVNMWGEDLNLVTNIVFTNGALDPCRRGGLTKPVGSVEYYLIEQAAHHFDLRGSHSKDPQSVVDVRKKEWHAIKNWLQEGKEM